MLFRFEEYADICYQAFGDRVKQWITLNEPWVVAIAGHATGELAPGMVDPGIADYAVAHNLIKAHAKAYRLYHSKYAATQNGMGNIARNVSVIFYAILNMFRSCWNNTQHELVRARGWR